MIKLLSSFCQNKFIMALMPFCLCFIFECMQGMLDGNDSSKIVSNAFCFLFFVFCLILRGKKKILFFQDDKLLVALIIIAIVASCGGAMWQGINIRLDITALFRSLVIGWMAFCYANCCNVSESNIQKIVSIVWGGVSLCIILSWCFNFGIKTYVDFNLGHKFYFQSINEFTFVYLSIWLWLFYFGSVGLKLLSTIITLMCFCIIGSKAFLPLAAIMVTCFCIEKLCFYCGKKITALVSLFFSVLASYFIFCENGMKIIFKIITYFLSNYSLGGEKLITKLSYLSPLSALMSERDRLWGYAVDLLLHHYSLYDFIFGRSFSGYGTAYGAYKNSSFSFAENDWLDIFMSYGVLGVICVFILFKNFLLIPVEEWAKNIKIYLLVLFLGAGFMTGHVMLFSFPVFTFAFLTGLASSHS